jgi:hypothetical protein
MRSSLRGSGRHTTCESIAFFAAIESRAVDGGAHILTIREKQLKERLGERFRELDVPLPVEWPDGRRAALLFVFEEEIEPKRLSPLWTLSTSTPRWMRINAFYTPNAIPERRPT